MNFDFQSGASPHGVVPEDALGQCNSMALSYSDVLRQALVRKMLVKRRLVEQLVGLGRSSIYARIQSGDFPRPVEISGNGVRWPLGEVLDWIESRQRTAPSNIDVSGVA